ncbi:zinc ribbon domain-containing protein [Spongiibacter taiwanensis]|uniref:FmdB family zinc ribbon protein n=1 Tax=Spongiibacter taiwanensis TaxID=1748242 RepID=UPI0020360E4C|nr:zinc ribbon domain-containing protein [Spongiibacter taiwanensis]USA44092.1 zinc ribbon domain-containing protein [Spongiibacter taiwanensis]
MPIYEYACGACGHEMEALQKMSDAALTECPACRQASLVKKISAAAFRLKGGGWYETDFKSGGTKKNLAGDSDAAPKASKEKSAPASGAAASDS